ncbi:unnamed protein product (macronuclear) [Paramecium tetraurelia]|uniref:Chromosome undetermined scaffold_1, whole genome shotgun sequence n=1 Tax=Paramecium tetraurelia TaxID=5888 RepID=Q6BGL4_PARTE|nr:hypothetical protein [Paramecium tetraurelia strain d4-2]XP_001423515.1 uncharacterized protein GSPATT00000553001 [Paramecium tetraurelia]CAH03206.1 hypothetical protein PTMB.09c [Paramecium tetraurelia]CAK56117.1 unnamed protein product [Paramecium tetraurelia]|eukprot:XP_001423515.1 hypothetical protein (macronuclear) [Paramecium tetraurelia strain d4-2]
MTEKSERPHIKKFQTFFNEAPSKTIWRTKTFTQAFISRVTKPATSVQKLKQFLHDVFPIVKGKTNEKTEQFKINLKKKNTYDHIPNPSKVSTIGKIDRLFKTESGQIEDKNQSKAEHLKRCITPQSRIENNCNSSLAISQLEEQLIDKNAASYVNMTLDISMNTNVLQQMALPSNQSHRELNFDAISNPILEKPESQENILLDQIKDGAIESEQDDQNKWKQVKNKASAFNAVTEPYRNKQKFFSFFTDAPQKIALKTKKTQKRLEAKLSNKPQIESQNQDSQNNEIKLAEMKKIENEQQSDEQKENNLEQSVQKDENKIENFQEQEQVIQTNQSKPQTDLTYNINDAQITNQDIDIDNQNNSKKHQQSVVNFISSSGALMKKKTMEMFSQIENKIKLQEGQRVSFRTQNQTDVENIKNDSVQKNQNFQIEKKNVNQVQEIRDQAQISDQDEYDSQVEPYLEEDLKISNKDSNNQFNYQYENFNQINDSQLNSRGELQSNDKHPQEITKIEKESVHQDSFESIPIFDNFKEGPKDTSRDQKSKITIQDNESNQLTSKLFNKDELRQQYDEINQEIQQLHFEKQQLLPKKNILIKSTFKPNYKKLAEISDDNEALYKAKDLVRKMNQKRKDKEERTKKQYDKIEEYFHNLQYLKESQEEMKNRYEIQRKLQIQNRIEDYQKKQKEFAQLQKISHNFVQKLINVGPQQGQLAKEFEDNVVSIKGGYRKVKLKNLGIELPKINENNNNAMFRR